MAYNNRESDYKRNASNAKKADLILEMDREISAKVDAISARLDLNNERLEAALARLGQIPQSADKSSEQGNVFDTLHGEYQALKREMRYLAAQNEHIFLELSEKIQKLAAAIGSGVPVQVSEPEQYAAQSVAFVAPPAAPAQIDYDELAAKVAELLPAQEYISPDYIASKVAEQIVMAEGIQSYANNAEEKEVAYAPMAAPAPVPVDLQLNEDELADRIALKVGGIKAEDFDILVDDDGCSSISDTIAKKLDYDAISSAIADKLRIELAYLAEREPDYEEMAAHISEKITVAGVNEQAIAEKAAAVIVGTLPVDTDEIADKVVSQLLGSMPAAEVNGEEICNTISEKLIERQDNHDYDIVIDEEGIGKINDYVVEEVRKTTEARFDQIELQLAELRELLIGEVEEQSAEELLAEGEEPFVAEEPTLVTVSELTEGNEEPVGEYNEELAELVEELEEVPAEGEITTDDLDEAVGGVDFENMMKYNRSFIARIIQSTDDQKEYYGRVKTALLSYAKVNSNMAWGAERFNKGRETIARFKIRGKTLCLYLALNPTDYQYSVYHHIDVSDNKSMHGTPMMVKIKSPRGVNKAIRLIDEMLEQRQGVKRTKSLERNYAAMYPFESIEELIEDGLVKDVSKNK